jgi:hypothetical protein
VGEYVLLKVNPKKISLKLGSCTNLTARLCGPFEILDRIGPVAYMLALPTSMNVHNVFHVLMSEIAVGGIFSFDRKSHSDVYMILTMLLIGI